MQESIHPKYNKIKVICTNGQEFETYSTYSKDKVLKLDIDPYSHPAWSDKKDNFVMNTNEVSKFKEKFDIEF